MDTGTVHQRVSVNSVLFSRLPEAPDGMLRCFRADVEVTDGSAGGSVAIGTIRGWMGWESWLPELLDNGHPVGTLAELMAIVAVEIGEGVGPTTCTA